MKPLTPRERAQARATLRSLLILEATTEDPHERVAGERASVEAMLTTFDVLLAKREARDRLGWPETNPSAYGAAALRRTGDGPAGHGRQSSPEQITNERNPE